MITLMPVSKIQNSHYERTAYVYVRQSTPLQVTENVESKERQYQLRQHAIDLGWSPSRVEVIDEDQGRSGRSAIHRTGFQRLASEVGLGKVGMVLMLEASRLARNNSDWYRLIEICGISGTLIADESAVYNPHEPNDRLLLGVKGTLSEAEIFTLRTRLHEGRWNKARKGRLKFHLPVGYVRGAADEWQLEPDEQVRERIGFLFDSFRRHGVARRVVCEFRQSDLTLPTHVVTREGFGALVWKTATLSSVVRMLHNPAYAGAYVYGRWDYTGENRSAKTGRSTTFLRDVAQWPVNLAQHHPAYISWEEYVNNQERLRKNWYRDRALGAVRNGNGLLQGLVYCGVCGQKMDVQHHTAGEKRSATYICCRDYQDGGEKTCQTMTARPVDTVVVDAFLQSVSPAELDIATRVLDQVEHELTTKRRQHELQLEQARYEARLAQRQYDAIDPDNRLVAAELERRWNEKLERVLQLERTFAQLEQREQWTLTPQERASITLLAQDLPALWNAPTTTNLDPKQLLRMVITSVQLDGVSRSGEIEIHIHWRSGAVTQHVAKRPVPGEWSLKTSDQAVARIHELLAQNLDYFQIADQLNQEGFRSAFNRLFNNMNVGYICRRDGLGRNGPHDKSKSAKSEIGGA